MLSVHQNWIYCTHIFDKQLIGLLRSVLSSEAIVVVVGVVVLVYVCTSIGTCICSSCITSCTCITQQSLLNVRFRMSVLCEEIISKSASFSGFSCMILQQQFVQWYCDDSVSCTSVVLGISHSCQCLECRSSCSVGRWSLWCHVFTRTQGKRKQ